MDFAFCNGAAIAACRRTDVRFPVTARMDSKITRRVTGIGEDAWTPIKYPHAIFDKDEQRWISDTQVAEVTYTAFANNNKHAVTVRLIVRRVRRLAPPHQGNCSPPGATTRSSPTAHSRCSPPETDHRDHAIIEQLIADLIDGPLAHLTSRDYMINQAWCTAVSLACGLLARLRLLALSGGPPRPNPKPCATGYCTLLGASCVANDEDA